MRVSRRLLIVLAAGALAVGGGSTLVYIAASGA
jgi:hypothetical protein